MSRDRNVPLGVLYGVGIATAYSVLAVGVYLVTGGAAFSVQGVTLFGTVAAYLFGGVFGGALVGYLMPATRTRLGAALVGMIACLPVAYGFGRTLWGPLVNWDVDQRLTFVLFALIMGGLAGISMWTPVRGENPGGRGGKVAPKSKLPG